jgi:hypothetical protein
VHEHKSILLDRLLKLTTLKHIENRFLFFGFLMLAFPAAVWAQTSTPTPAETPLIITVNDTNKPIRVDGYLVDWPVSRMILLNQKSQVTYGLLNWKSKDDFSGRIFLTYDDQYLYLSAIVQNTAGIVNDNSGMSLWDGDCIELFLSTDSTTFHRDRISKGDYHIGFTPGSGAGNARMFCFNKEETIGGGRISARSTGHGYILEACIPLTYFEGLEIGPGKTTRFNLALDGGGSASGNRRLQLDLTGNPQSWQNLSLWGDIQWIGKTQVSVPVNDEENLYQDLVADGTKGATYWGQRDLSGVISDEKGKPIEGAVVSTWPKSKTVTTDKNGQFNLDQVKLYDNSVVYARADGYEKSLASVERKSEAVSISLKTMPDFFSSQNGLSPAFYGQVFQVPASGDLLGLMTQVQDWLKPLPLNILKLVGTEFLSKTKDEQYQALDQFVAYARQLGAEPMIELPIRRDDPSAAADWVRHCNVDKNEHVLYWTIGDEPDLYAEKRKGTEFDGYNVYDYINDFREIYNEVKKTDPSVLILGPELAWRYTSGEDDWLTPFIQFDGDIVDLASIHHYGSIKTAQCNPGSVLEDVHHMQTLSHDLKSRILINADAFIPLVVTGGNICLESTENTVAAQMALTPPAAGIPTASGAVSAPASKVPEDVGPNSFWAGVWLAEQAGTLMKDYMPMAFFSYLKGYGALDFFDAKGAKPDYWVLRLMSSSMKSKVIWSQVQNGNVSAYATQDAKTKDVCLMILNKGGNYYHPKIILKNVEANVSVDAGLDQAFDFELPYYSIAFFNIKADKSHDEVVLYTKKMALEGKPPLVSVIKPW